ncbi:hypothetical protein V1260_04165 [Brachybacterium sp. J144]|uniref:hypothetical protein n=1 Tax=Brachybacterium sp. J144 TaxID=3116487 RepID=UPI002E785A74|nr:hypothetical protein [Brachybacterium sp. J144]MEE1649977.1 hypothetical protein [Brachybacterium sp. J144]
MSSRVHRAALSCLLALVLCGCGSAPVSPRADESEVTSTPAAEATEESGAEVPGESEAEPVPSELGESRDGPGGQPTASPAVESSTPAASTVRELTHTEHLGPFLTGNLSGEVTSVDGPTTLEERWGGEIALSMQVHLPGEEIVEESWGVGWDGQEVFLVGLARVRTPADGLEPESERLELVRVAPSDPDVAVARVDLDVPGRDVRIANGAPEAVVVLEYRGFDAALDQALGVQMREGGGILWTTPAHQQYVGGRVDWGSAGIPSESIGLFDEYLSDGPCWGLSAVVAVDLSSGREMWREEATAGDDCLLAESSLEAGGRVLTFRSSNSPAAGDGTGREQLHSRSLATGARHVIDGEIPAFDAAVDLGGAVAWISPRWDLTDDETPMWAFVDLETGERLLELPQSRVEELDLTVEVIHDGVAYVTTTDEQLALDVRTGEELGTWTARPVDVIGGDVLMSDGTLHRGPWSYGGV